MKALSCFLCFCWVLLLFHPAPVFSQTDFIITDGMAAIISGNIPAARDKAIDDAWNALLVGIPEARIRLLEGIRKHYRIFLLSNSNEIHYLEYAERFRQQYGYHDFSAIFEKTYFSYQCHLRKPDPLIFKLVLNENNLTPSETLFIDDTLVHVKTACDLGITGYQLRDGEEITDLFYTS